MDRELSEAVSEMRKNFDYMSDETFERAVSIALKEKTGTEDWIRKLREGKALKTSLIKTNKDRCLHGILSYDNENGCGLINIPCIYPEVLMEFVRKGYEDRIREAKLDD